MKNKNEVFYPPDQTKADTITDEQAYLDEMLSSWRKAYEAAQAQPPRKKTRKHLLFYVLGVALLLAGVLFYFLVEPDAIGLIIISVSCLVFIVGLLISPRKPRYKPVNPFNLRLIKPTSMEVIPEDCKDCMIYWFFFDYSDGTGNLYSALTETEFNEEEKQKICSSFLNGNTVVAVSNDDNRLAFIIEY